MGYSKKHSRRHGRKRSHKQRGGGGAADFVSSIVGGTVTQQMNNVFGTSNVDSNTIRPLGQSGGGRRRRMKQKGGYWAQVINNAIVPLTLFALNKQAHNKSRRSAFGKSVARTMKRMR
jgi:hypothetical protein